MDIEVIKTKPIYHQKVYSKIRKGSKIIIRTTDANISLIQLDKLLQFLETL
jgi:hypothetical protein